MDLRVLGGVTTKREEHDPFAGIIQIKFRAVYSQPRSTRSCQSAKQLRAERAPAHATTLPEDES